MGDTCTAWEGDSRMGAKWTLKYGLIAMCITAVLLTVVGMSIYRLQTQENDRNAKEEALASLSAQAHQLAIGTSMRLRQLEMIAHTDTMRLGTNATRLAYLEREIVRLDRQFYRLGFTNRDGIMYVTGGRTIDASKQPGYDEAMDGQSILTPPVADSLNPNVHLVLARVPYHNTGEQPIGIISGSIRLADLFQEYYHFQYASPQKLYFIDDNGTTYAVMERGAIARTEALPMELVSTISNRAQGMESIKLGHEQHHVIYVAVEGTTWHMAIAVPDRELFVGRGELKLRLTAIFVALV